MTEIEQKVNNSFYHLLITTGDIKSQTVPNGVTSGVQGASERNVKKKITLFRSIGLHVIMHVNKAANQPYKSKGLVAGRKVTLAIGFLGDPL